MALDLQIAIVSLQPSTYTCELFHGPPYTERELRGHIDPLQTVPLAGTGGIFTATFSANPGIGYAIRLRDGSGKVLARSNARTLNSNKSLLVIDGTDRISEAEFGQFAPAVPFTDDKTTVDHLVLDFVGKDLRMFAHVLYDGLIDKRFTFDYRFRLVPVDIPVWTPVTSLSEDETPEDTLTIDKISLTIDADRNRQELIMGILHPFIRRRLDAKVQRRFHESIQKQASANALKPVVTLTGTDVVDGQHVDLKIGILADAPG
jgi:hypothetical protein